MSNPNLYYSVLKRPLVTEKSTVLTDIRNQYTFEIAANATKSEVRKAIETLFDVSVKSVNVMNVPGKLKRILGRPGRTSGWRKAIVTLAEGDSIDIV